MSFWHLFAVNLGLGVAGVADQVAGTGVLASLGPWGAIGSALINVIGHAVIAATGNGAGQPGAPGAGH